MSHLSWRKSILGLIVVFAWDWIEEGEEGVNMGSDRDERIR